MIFPGFSIGDRPFFGHGVLTSVYQLSLAPRNSAMAFWGVNQLIGKMNHLVEEDGSPGRKISRIHRSSGWSTSGLLCVLWMFVILPKMLFIFSKCRRDLFDTKTLKMIWESWGQNRTFWYQVVALGNPENHTKYGLFFEMFKIDRNRKIVEMWRGAGGSLTWN